VLDQIAQKPGVQALSFPVLRTLTQRWDTVRSATSASRRATPALHLADPALPGPARPSPARYHLHREGQPSGGGYSKPPPDTETLSQLAHYSSTHERRAMEAEREAVAMYRAYLMRDQIGQRFEGTVSAVTSFGAFVEIEEPFVEGLIKLESLGNEPFTYDQVQLVVPAKQVLVSLSDKVTVEINNVSVVRRRSTSR
jgi:ribonuclease R